MYVVKIFEMRFILANLQKNCRIRLNYFKADSLFKNNLHIKTEPVTDGADATEYNM